MANTTSQHILSTSTNLLGFCLVVLTSIHVNNASKNTLIDEVTSVIALFLILSVMFSFLSIRTENREKEKKYENIADWFFIVSVVGVLFDIVFMVVNYWSL
ncbi:MAG: hypothetical protein AB7S65_06130 [Sulfuricurvum sp.]